MSYPAGRWGPPAWERDHVGVVVVFGGENGIGSWDMGLVCQHADTWTLIMILTIIFNEKICNTWGRVVQINSLNLYIVHFI